MNKQEKHLKKKTKNEENRSCKNEGTETKNEWQSSISRNASVMREWVKNAWTSRQMREAWQVCKPKVLWLVAIKFKDAILNISKLNPRPPQKTLAHTKSMGTGNPSLVLVHRLNRL